MNYLELNNKIMQKENGFYSLHYDVEAVTEYERHINKKMRFSLDESKEIKRIEKLIEEGYYVNILDSYEKEAVQNIIQTVYNYEFKFQSYMAISKFYETYAMKSNDGSMILERYEDRIIICALYIAQGDAKKALDYAVAMIEQRYQPATPTFLNAGKVKCGELVSCFLLEMDDSLNSINYVLNTCGQLSKIGGGVAVNISKIRARGEVIKDIKGAATGIIPVLKLLEDTFSYVNQLGQRNGAGVAYLNIFHKDIIEFLDTKKINASEKSRLQTLSIGVIIPDKFLELAKLGQDYYVFGPKSVYDAYGVHLDDMDMNEWYDKLITNDSVVKELLNPRKILNQIAKTQFQSGYPYLFFKDTANREHALKKLGQIKMSNLCTEIYQLQETSIINDYGIEDDIKRDVLCNLGSLNIVNVMENKNLRESVHTAMECLTDVSGLVDIKNAPGVMKANRELHAVGLGAMNLHGYLAKNFIPYESEDAKEFVDIFFAAVNFYSIEKSMLIAKEKGKTFEGFRSSTYSSGEYFSRYIDNEFTPNSKKLSELFNDIKVPTKEDWLKLKEDVMKYGMYNAYRLSIAPTQSIGYIQNATPSILPCTEQIERRTYGNSTTYYPMPYLDQFTALAYKSAFYMDMTKVIDLLSIVQSHIDQGLSATLYVNSNTSTKELVKYYMYAYKKGLKALYYTRTKNLDFNECTSCSV